LKANVTGLPWRRIGSDQLEITLLGASLFVARALGWDVTVDLPYGETTVPDAGTEEHCRHLLQCYRQARRSLLASSETGT